MILFYFNSVNHSLYFSFFRLDFIQFSFLTPFTIHISDNHFRSLSLSLILSFSPFVLGQKRSLSFVLRRLSFSLSVNRFSIYLSLSVFRSSPLIFLPVGPSLLYLSQSVSLSFVLRRLSFSLSVHRVSIYLSLSVCLSFFAVYLSPCRFIASLSISVCQSLFLSLLLHCQFLFPFPVRVTINLLL